MGVFGHVNAVNWEGNLTKIFFEKSKAQGFDEEEKRRIK
jgi:hypothetical protein